jgi:ABC-2 type transport system ATP-binding protein
VAGRPSVWVRGVHKNFGQVRAVRGIDLTVSPGEVVAFLGPNGAGKTTTIDMMLGRSRPSSGSVEVFGMPAADAVSRGLVTAVMQTEGLLRDLTVAETVRLVATLFADTRPVYEVLRRAGIADIGGRRVGKCSGAQQQRLRFALALLPDPELLVLDEPTTAWMSKGRREFWSAICEDTERGRTVLFATHYLEEADAFADRIVLLSGGRIVADGTAAEVKALAAGRTVRATLPAAHVASLRSLPGADTVEVRGDTILVHPNDSDAVARYLLNRTPARDVEITARNLEDAFLALTAPEEADAAEQPDPATDMASTVREESLL